MIAYYDEVASDLKFASRNWAVWTTETVDAAGSVGLCVSLSLDADGNPCIGYIDASRQRLKLARRSGGVWSMETVEAAGPVGSAISLALDAEGNPRVAGLGAPGAGLAYVSGAIELSEPKPHEVWPAGAQRVVRWNGTGRVDLYLSADGGTSWQLLGRGLTGGEATIQVPRVPYPFVRLKLERALPHSISISDGLLKIERTVELLQFSATRAPEGGTRLAWSTTPGVADLAGYRVERAKGTNAGWETLMPLAQATNVLDPTGEPGHRYRLFALDGLGGETMIGETRLPSTRSLEAWPLPYRGGALHVRFTATAGGTPTDVALLDVAGRQVASLAGGTMPAGEQQVIWNGRDADGRTVPAGLYFLRLRSGGAESQFKLIVLN